MQDITYKDLRNLAIQIICSIHTLCLFFAAGVMTRVVLAIISSRKSVNCALLNGIFLVCGGLFTSCFTFFKHEYAILVSYSVFLGVFSGKSMSSFCLDLLLSLFRIYTSCDKTTRVIDSRHLVFFY